MRTCDNKEIRKEYIEEFVLSELERKIFNDKAGPILVQKINLHIQEQSENEKVSIEVIEKEMQDIEKQISKIVVAIMQGFAH